ncbi:hypothetical protein HJC23_003178 [Cyclotella cryptica]|uniref:HSF-type DNA-binding domain-containing protein n=1 Tax=Cyclotella cryptica TaxID=29204 RepID=A0ABD3PPT9_9STRA|eukprot:CCRYP_012844-RA/>CCRYP_012844-RA protein AED:0.03 eAED:0.03 QI:55/1/1/1/1/1/3/257/637
MSAMRTFSSPSPPPQGNPNDHLHQGTIDRTTQLQATVDSDHVSVDSTSLSPSGSFAQEDTNSEIIAPNRQFALPRPTDHTYNDYATKPPSPHECPITKKSNSNFPAKLHRMISNPANSQAITWQYHGRAWKVIDKKFLVDVVIPKYFLQTRYESFTRQLSGWGFKRLYQSGPDYQCYYHECFLRGLPHLTRLMKRVEPHQGNILPNVEAEPNFSVMPIPLSIEYTQPPPPANLQPPSAEFQANPAAVIYPSPNWAANNGPPYTPYHPYGYYHYNGKGPFALASYPMVQPSVGINPNPNHHQQPQQPCQQHQMHQSHYHEHLIHHLSRENSARSGALMPSLQRHLSSAQAESTYPPNVFGCGQHQQANSYELSSCRKNEYPSVVNAPENAKADTNLSDRLFRPNHGITYTTNPRDIGPHTMQHQHSAHNSILNLQQQRLPHVNAPDLSETRVGDQSKRPSSVYDSPNTLNPNELAPYAMQHEHLPYDAFLHLQQQWHLHVNAQNNTEIRLTDQSKQPHPGYFTEYTPNRNEIETRAMQHQHSSAYESFLDFQHQQSFNRNAPINNEKFLADQSQELHPSYARTYTHNPNEIEPRAMQHQNAPFDFFSNHYQQQHLDSNARDNHNEMNPGLLDQQRNRG